MSEKKKGVIIGVDPHKMSVTIEVVDTHERLLGTGRFDTTNAGYADMRRYVKQWCCELRRNIDDSIAVVAVRTDLFACCDESLWASSASVLRLKAFGWWPTTGEHL